MRAAPSRRTTLKRHPERGRHDRQTINDIVDEALFCHMACVVDGSPRIIPTIHARVGDTLYVHGSTASATLRALRSGSEVCVAITLLDGLVLARSAFDHSMNYRSVMVFGTPREVLDPEKRWEAQRALVDHVVAGRSSDVRMPDEQELKQTAIFAISLEEASAKVRSGPPKDKAEDLGLPVWAGELPLRLEPGAPIPDPALEPGLDPPANVTDYRR